MSDTVSDPFSMAAGIGQPQLPSQQPGMFGVSPSTWESIAQLGAGAIQGANQRTAGGQLANGTGIAGGVAGAVQGYYGDVQNQAKLRSALASQGASTQGQNIGNQAALSNLRLTRARNAFSQSILEDPAFRQQLQSAMGVGAPQGGVLGVGGVAGGPLTAGGGPMAQVEPAVHRLESGGSMAPGITGDGGKAAGPMQVHQAALDDVNRANGTQYTLPMLAQNPQLGKWAGDQYLQQQMARFGSRAGMAAYNAGPGSVQNAIRSGGSVQGLSPSYQQALGSSGQLGPVDPQGALAQSQRLMSQANQLEVYKSLGLPIPGDPAALRDQAKTYLDLATAGPKAGAAASADAGVKLATGGQIASNEANAKNASDFAYAGPTAAAKSANSNVDIRPGGMAGLVDAQGNRTFMKNPQLERTTDALGNPGFAHVSPALPGAPAGTPGTADPVLGPDGKPFVAGVPKNVQEARDKAYEDFQGKDTDSYLAAQNTHQWLEQMNHAADTLNSGGGFVQTGPNAPKRLSFVSTANDAARMLGLGDAFGDANKIASWEELKKATTTAGFELSSHYEGHARQAASTIENATSAVPSATNSPLGFKMVSAGIQEAAQSAIDLHEYKQQIYNEGGDLTKAEVAFYQQNRPEQYARRAISTITPYSIQKPSDFDRYLPGTYVSLPNGKLTQVPMRQGAPPIPQYLTGPQPQTSPQ